MVVIGIDTGGTYTDAVVVDTETGEVFAKAKSLTTKEDLSAGIGAALDALPTELRQHAQGISLSTTLATNACVEGKGGRAKLVIVGVDEATLRSLDVDRTYGIPSADVLAVDVAVDPSGKNVVQPNWEAICDANPDFFGDADSFGIAGMYALNNGGAMEKAGEEYLVQRFGALVVKAIDVADEVNVYERGATALLNARLVPVICEFLDAIGEALRQRGMEDVPVSVVRSDGSLMSAKLARIRPVETILSGPAASVRGAAVLCPANEALVVDIGGTTSDIALFHDGNPVRTDHIRIGGWKTQVAGIAIDTIGLGGDSAARYTKEGELSLSAQRVMPLCIAAARWPQVVRELETYLRSASPKHLSRYELYCLLQMPRNLSRYTEAEQKFMKTLEGGPVSLNDQRVSRSFLNTHRLEAEGVVIRSGMTPTDAMHLIGILSTFDAHASELGAQCMLKTYHAANAAREEKAVEELASDICNLARKRLYEQAGRMLLADSYWHDVPDGFDAQLQEVFDRNWERSVAGQDEALGAFRLLPQTDATLVGIGAPTHVFLPEAACALGAQWCVPEHAEVANAVGAACAQVVVDAKVRVKPVRGSFGMIEGYRILSADESLFVPAEKVDDTDRAAERKAKDAARDIARRIVRNEASKRGAGAATECTITEEETSYVGAADAQTVVYEWVFTAHVG